MTENLSNERDLTSDSTEVVGGEPGPTRRSLLGKGAAVAAVAAVAGIASSKQVQAANGDTMNVGTTTSGTATTKVAGGSTFWAEDGSSTASASLYGSQSGTDGAYGVRGKHDGTLGTGVFSEAGGSSGRGVHGKSSGSAGLGVVGEHLGDTRAGTGVRGVSDRGVGVIGAGTVYDLQADGSGRVGLTKAGNSGTTTTTGTVGTIARDSNGNLWYCYASGLWQRLGGPNAAGAFHAIAPVRAFDSRIGAIPASGRIAASEARVVSVKDGRDNITGAVTLANAVPIGAKAVAYNVTATATVVTGFPQNFLSVVPGNVASTQVASLNWSGPNVDIGNAGIVGIDGSRQVTIIGGPNGTFHGVLDITGYFI